MRLSIAAATVLAVAQIISISPSMAQPPKTVNTIQSTARATVASAPTLQIATATSGQSDLCVGEISGAYGNAMLAVTLDAPRRDQICSLLRQSKWAADLGELDLAREIMCASADWSAAAARIGHPCLSEATHRRTWSLWR